MIQISLKALIPLTTLTYFSPNSFYSTSSNICSSSPFFPSSGVPFGSKLSSFYHYFLLMTSLSTQAYCARMIILFASVSSPLDCAFLQSKLDTLVRCSLKLLGCFQELCIMFDDKPYFNFHLVDIVNPAPKI